MGYTIEKIWADNTRVVVFTDMGHRCGYVGVKEPHILYGKEYGDVVMELLPYVEGNIRARMKRFSVPTAIRWLCGTNDELYIDSIFDVHGGITYSRGSGKSKYPIEVKGEKVWWFGFDCAHFEDGNIHNTQFPVRSLEFCIDECDNLAQQFEDADAAWRFRRALLRRKYV